jgi:thioredoxin 2
MSSVGSRQTPCITCSAINRVPDDKPASAAVCGRCGAPLGLDKAAEVDDEQLSLVLKSTTGLVLLDVWAPWCGPCRAMAPEFALAAKEMAGRARLIKLNADQSRETRSLGVTGIPALILFRNGQIIDRKAGLMRADMITAWVGEYAETPATL